MRLAIAPAAPLLALLLAAALPSAALDAGQKVPPVALASMDASPVKAPASVAELKGQVVYVDFWASWCVPCRRSMPALQSLYRRQRERGFIVVGVNKDPEARDAERFLRSFPVTFPLVADGDDAVAKAFGVKAMPSGYLIDRAGVVRQIHHGFTADTEKTLEREVEALLQEKP
jgi:thiol-disulfide isomerase/thioredoxin